MKKSILFLIAFININTYAINNDIKNKIEHAIKKSKTKLLNQYLKEISLTKTEKAKFLELANSVIKLRKIKTRFNDFILFRNDTEGAGLVGVTVGAILGAVGVYNLNYSFSSTLSDDFKTITRLFSVGTLIISSISIIAGANEIRKEIRFKKIKQKYLDAVKIKQILNLSPIMDLEYA